MVKFLVFFFLAITLCWAGRRKIDRPCKLDDYKCIGAILAANSNCNKNVKGYLPDKFSAIRFRVEGTNYNFSYVERNLMIKNFNETFVSDFFYNPHSKNAVLRLDFPGYSMEADRELINHHSMKEDTHYYHIRATYPLISVTVNLPSRTQMDLCTAGVFTEVIGPAKIHIDPKDQATAKFLFKVLSKLNIFKREIKTYVGFPVVTGFIDNLICDYKCEPFILD